MFDLRHVEKISPTLWEIPRRFRADMRTAARIYADETLLREMARDRSLEQLVNVATLPGLRGWVLAMPDAHEGYGFPVGGVAAFDPEEGVLSPGGIGYDINCGVRLLRTDLTREELTPFLKDLCRSLFAEIPSGVGRGGRFPLSSRDLDAVLLGGARRVVEQGYGEPDDLLHTESGGVLEGADPEVVSDLAKSRGRDQLGTLGAGNHFVEVGFVESVFDAVAAEALGIPLGACTVLIHTGSRGLGHQVATDSIRAMSHAAPAHGLSLPDRELACAPFRSREGQTYFSAMNAAANFAWANRQLISWAVRKAFHEVLGLRAPTLSVVYDVAHNIAKVEPYEDHGMRRALVVHRKGATRAFPGQPVLIPGSMGTASHVLLGQELSLKETFGSCCHGAGRRMSRTQARRVGNVHELRGNLSTQGIVVNAGSEQGLLEEAPAAYKDVDNVVNVVHAAGVAKKVARLRPLAVVKG